MSRKEYPKPTIAGRILAERPIIYRPQFKLQIGSVTATLLLNQINHWWLVNKQQPFWKFAAPCEHRKYRVGDSWQEELGFSRSEYDTALKHIATRIQPKDRFTSALRQTFNSDGNLSPVNQIVLYWRDRDNVTWFWLNEELHEKHLTIAYENFTPSATPVADDETFADDGIQHSSNATILHSTNDGIQHYPYTEMNSIDVLKENFTPSATPVADDEKPKRQNPMYDAVLLMFGMSGASNGLYIRFLTNKATKQDGKKWFEANVTPAVTVEELHAWWSWYCIQQPDPKYRVKEPLKIQNSILEYRRIGTTQPQPSAALQFAKTIIDNGVTPEAVQSTMYSNPFGGE